MKASDGYVVDHKNHNQLDNRKENLTITEHYNNSTNRKSRNSNNQSGYRNVFWNSNLEKWQVSLCKNYKTIIVGYFDDVHEAGSAASKARQEYYGEYKGKN